MRFGRKQEREKLRNERRTAETVGTAWSSLEQEGQAGILDILLERLGKQSPYSLDIAIIAEDRNISCKSTILSELRPQIIAVKKSGAEAAERAAAARRKKAYLRKCAADYEKNGSVE